MMRSMQKRSFRIVSTSKIRSLNSMDNLNSSKDIFIEEKSIRNSVTKSIEKRQNMSNTTRWVAKKCSLHDMILIDQKITID